MGSSLSLYIEHLNEGVLIFNVLKGQSTIFFSTLGWVCDLWGDTVELTNDHVMNTNSNTVGLLLNLVT